MDDISCQVLVVGAGPGGYRARLLLAGHATAYEGKRQREDALAVKFAVAVPSQLRGARQ